MELVIKMSACTHHGSDNDGNQQKTTINNSGGDMAPLHQEKNQLSVTGCI